MAGNQFEIVRQVSLAKLFSNFEPQKRRMTNSREKLKPQNWNVKMLSGGDPPQMSVAMRMSNRRSRQRWALRIKISKINNKIY